MSSNAGRPRKPTKLKKLTGTYQPSRNLPNEMTGPEMTSYDAPEGLSNHARKEWERIIPLMRQTGVLSSLDTSALFALCNEWGKYKEAEEKCASMGRVVKSPTTGFPMINPYETISGQSYKRYKEMAVQFGLTPASRTKIASNPPANEQHPFEAAVQGRMKIAK